ncbi:nuclear transport factor 2 family protein [Catenulispora yoronensis]|uniref:Nuclear transport factor 2 family protein n=1 Tax=Catenulispora yoronensis TaxID=450799 RepID=A0ABP5GW97_9ACTN
MNAHADTLADRLAIVDTVIAYATAVDTRDWGKFEALFTPDAEWEYRAGGEHHTGPERITARVRPSIERLDATQHLLTNHVVAVDGDTATHTCYYLAQHLRGTGRFLAAGRYVDELRRADGRWLIAGRVLISTWAEGDPSILRD